PGVDLIRKESPGALQVPEVDRVSRRVAKNGKRENTTLQTARMMDKYSKELLGMSYTHTNVLFDSSLLDKLMSWQGRSETTSDTITAAPVLSLSATLDWDSPPPSPGNVLPELWHWLY